LALPETDSTAVNVANTLKQTSLACVNIMGKILTIFPYHHSNTQTCSVPLIGRVQSSLHLSLYKPTLWVFSSIHTEKCDTEAYLHDHITTNHSINQSINQSGFISDRKCPQ